MRILYVLPFVPWPIKVRSSNLIPRLAQRHDIHLVCLSEGKGDTSQLDHLARLCKSVAVIPHSKVRGGAQSLLALPRTIPLRIAYCRNPEMSQAVKAAIQQTAPEVIYIERWRALQYVPRDCDIPVLCDPTDSMLLYNRRLMKVGNWMEKVLGFEESLKFRSYEGELAKRCDISVFCSKVDLDVVAQIAPESDYAIVPNGVDCQQFALKEEREEDPATIVFTGNFSYRPNQLAVDYFLAGVFPKVRARIADARFLAVGKGASAFFARKKRDPAIEVHDFVPQLRPSVAKATVAVAPITVGTGVSNKLLEAFATGTPIVSTPMACGDLPLVDGNHLFIAEDPNTFSDRVITLLKDKDLRRKMRVSARRLVEEKYDWEKVTRQLEELFVELHRRRRVHTGHIADSVELFPAACD